MRIRLAGAVFVEIGGGWLGELLDVNVASI